MGAVVMLSKVIAALECCVSENKDCFDCPYEWICESRGGMAVEQDALELLRSIPRTCEECKHDGSSSGEEPCRSCVQPGSNWRWKYEG